MNKRAEQIALNTYPIKGEWIGNQYGEWDGDVNSGLRLACQRGYEQAEKDLGWHSVEESLPEIDEEVIVLTNDDGFTHPCPLKIYFAHIIDPDEVMNIGGKPYKIESHNGWNIPGVKYWMSCPKLPE